MLVGVWTFDCNQCYLLMKIFQKEKFKIKKNLKLSDLEVFYH